MTTRRTVCQLLRAAAERDPPRLQDVSARTQLERQPGILLDLDPRGAGQVRELALPLEREQGGHHEPEDGDDDEQLGQGETAGVAHDAPHFCETSHSSRTVLAVGDWPAAVSGV